MATEILMPQMGESIAEGTLTRWLAKVGDRVERDEPLLEISTDKVDAEIPAPASGVVVDIRRQEGETVPVGDVLGMIGVEGEDADKAANAVDVAGAADASSDSGLAGAEGEAQAAGESVSESVGESAAATETEETEGELTLEQRLRLFSSPVVRKIAGEENVDIRQVEGTGIKGRVTKQDILAFIDRRARGEVPAAASAPTAAPAQAASRASSASTSPAATSPAATSTGPAPAAASSGAAPAARAAGDFRVAAYHAGENVTIEPMDRIRQRTAAHMVYSKATSAHVSTVFHVDMTKVAVERSRAKDGFARDTGTKLTFMPFIFRAVCDALHKFPQLNASIDGTNIVYKKDINLGMAVAIPGGGLIVPVLKRADEKNLVGLARTANDLAERARIKKLLPDEVAGGTFTITNPGIFGSLFGTPIINQPQVAILGIGAIEKRAVVLTDEDGMDSLAIRTMCYFALTFDHRLVDGADADQFMIAIKDSLEQSTWDELRLYR